MFRDCWKCTVCVYMGCEMSSEEYSMYVQPNCGQCYVLPPPKAFLVVHFIYNIDCLVTIFMSLNNLMG